MRNKKVVSLICAVAVMGSLSMGATSASAAGFTLPKLPTFTLPSNVGSVVNSAKGCASQKSLPAIASCLLNAVKPALPKGTQIPSTSSILSQLGGTGINLSQVQSALKGFNISNLSGLLSGLK